METKMMEATMMKETILTISRRELKQGQTMILGILMMGSKHRNRKLVYKFQKPPWPHL